METDFFAVLDLRRDALPEEVDRAFLARSLSLAAQRDEGQTAELRDRVAKAHRVLADPRLRRLFLLCPDHALVREAARGADFERELSAFLRQMLLAEQSLAPGGCSAARPGFDAFFAASDVHVTLRVQLEEVYREGFATLTYTRLVFDELDKVMRPEQKSRTVLLNADVVHEPERRFSDEGNVYPHITTALVLSVELETHPRFAVEGHDLVLRHSLSLRDALTRHSLEVDDVEGTPLQVTLLGVVTPETVVCVPGRGLRRPRAAATRDADESRGQLKITFDIRFPEFLPEESKSRLRGLLGR